MKDTISAYSNKRSFFTNQSAYRSYVEHLVRPIDIAIVIPACNEYPTIFETLESIYASFKSLKIDIDCRIAFIVVVNNKQSSSDNVKENNQILINKLEETCLENFELIVLDFTKDVFCLPEKQGVGFARKIGMDFALLCNVTVIACMDADTLVSENYISTLVDFFENCKKAKKTIPIGGVCNFYHQKNTDTINQSIIDQYELYIKKHSEHLKRTGTPYWLWALGPTIVCSSYGYCSSGGMNKYLAGEDFYFLKSLIKVHIQQLNNGFSVDTQDFPVLQCEVYPQSRYSDRVLFGTGKKIHDVRNGVDSIEFYNDTIYEEIRLFITFVADCKGNIAPRIDMLRSNLPRIYAFLEAEDFFLAWEKIYRQNQSSEKRIFSAFHSWFDGLKILRLIHVLMKDN